MCMTIKDIGESGLISRLTRGMKMPPSVVKGPGDDCAVVAFDKKHYQLLTCDMLVQGVDFTAGTDPYLVGRKALAVSVSDIAACAGQPVYCLVSMGMRADTPVAYVDRLWKGMRSLARRFKITIVGGDLSRADSLVIDVSMTGIVGKDTLVLRGGAGIGDIIFVSGALGGARRGRQFTFMPRIKEARYLADNFRITAMMDISDGLAQDLGHIARESKTGAVIYEELVPLRRQAQGISGALYDGEDFELLFTMPRKEAHRLLSLHHKLFKAIGEIVPESDGLRIVDTRGRERRLDASGGYRHF